MFCKFGCWAVRRGNLIKESSRKKLALKKNQSKRKQATGEIVFNRIDGVQYTVVKKDS
jgi:hypothetical protein